MKMKNAQKANEKANGLWQKTKYANLVRNVSSGNYFARFRSNGKLIWRGLDTAVLTIAAQRLPDKIKEVKDEQALLASGSDPWMIFEAGAKIYLERIQASPDYKPKTKAYHEERLEALFKSWPDVKAKAIKDITKSECVEWRNRFAVEYSPTSFNHTLGILRAIIEIGIEAGARRDNPAKAKEMKRLRETSKRLRLPEPEQFEQFVKEIENGGGGFSRPCAELVQFLAFGGFRLSEAKHITWADCDFGREKIIVTGEPGNGLKGRRAGETREVPMIPDMRRLLERIKKERPEDPPTAKVMRVSECQKAMNRAAKKIGIARLTHHDLRHLFATRCIESGVDIPTVSRWLGHKDGGALAMKVYGHLRDHHSANMAQKVIFSGAEPSVAPVPPVPTAAQNGQAVAVNGMDKKAIAQAKAKYGYPWWVSANPLEVFWGQLNEEVQIVPLDKYRLCAQEAMQRDVFAEEFADRQALIDELMERVAKPTLDEIMAKIQAKQAGQPVAAQAAAQARSAKEKE
jgi:integrase